MSHADWVIAAATPLESKKGRAEARVKATAAAEPGDWLSLVLEHHSELEVAVAAVEDATTVDERIVAFNEFAILLTGHSIAEEGVLYPCLSANSATGQVDMGYSEQAWVKVQMAALEKLDPMSREFEKKFEDVKDELFHHMYEEEGNRFLDLKEKLSPEEQEIMTARYEREFVRYVGGVGVAFGDEDETEEWASQSTSTS